MTIFSINTRQHLSASDATIVNKLCEILPYFTTKDDKLKLYNILVEYGTQIFSKKVSVVCNKLTKKDNEYISLHLPLDKSKTSNQISYFRAKRK